jgi:hypothetical protein
MTPRTTVRLFLTAAGFYDGILGALFLFVAPRIFSLAGIPVPSHWGYVHFGAALLLIFALMFFAAAIQPAGNRNLVAFGMLLKIAYVSVVVNEWLHGSIPPIFLLFALFDVVWFFLLAWSFYIVGRPVAAPAAAASPIP